MILADLRVSNALGSPEDRFFSSIIRWSVLLGACLAWLIMTLLIVPQALAQQDIYCLSRDQDSRQLVIEVVDANTGLPCAVIDNTHPDRPELLWRAEHESAFCRNKMRDLIQKFFALGWMCISSQDRLHLEPTM